MKNDSRILGHCSCKSVTYELLNCPMFVNCCHCTDCQRETGSAFVINGILETHQVKLITGNPEKILIPSQSGKGQNIHRCPTCKIALWSNYGGAHDVLRFVRIGTLQEPFRFPPQAFIFTRSKLPWVTLNPDIPSFDIFYDYKEMWSEESRARRRLVDPKFKH
ncbi:MAG: GFA family protein [Bdellovibrionota bacterium]